MALRSRRPCPQNEQFPVLSRCGDSFCLRRSVLLSQNPRVAVAVCEKLDEFMDDLVFNRLHHESFMTNLVAEDVPIWPPPGNTQILLRLALCIALAFCRSAPQSLTAAQRRRAFAVIVAALRAHETEEDEALKDLLWSSASRLGAQSWATWGPKPLHLLDACLSPSVEASGGESMRARAYLALVAINSAAEAQGGDGYGSSWEVLLRRLISELAPARHSGHGAWLVRSLLQCNRTLQASVCALVRTSCKQGSYSSSVRRQIVQELSDIPGMSPGLLRMASTTDTLPSDTLGGATLAREAKLTQTEPDSVHCHTRLCNHHDLLCYDWCGGLGLHQMLSSLKAEVSMASRGGHLGATLDFVASGLSKAAQQRSHCNAENEEHRPQRSKIREVPSISDRLRLGMCRGRQGRVTVRHSFVQRWSLLAFAGQAQRLLFWCASARWVSSATSQKQAFSTVDTGLDSDFVIKPLALLAARESWGGA
mmetsp:Transcript_14673/g.32205  ORF Transcript_14673/g.32205 Transcript_14673/m.32205 type:complete len:479 (+) Transcript_14673:66-1502(+)